jgi:hypothetical protein
VQPLQPVASQVVLQAVLLQVLLPLLALLLPTLVHLPLLDLSHRSLARKVPVAAVQLLQDPVLALLRFLVQLLLLPRALLLWPIRRMQPVSSLLPGLLLGSSKMVLCHSWQHWTLCRGQFRDSLMLFGLY